MQEFLRILPLLFMHLFQASFAEIFEPRHDKTCLCHMRTTKMQMSLHIRGLISAFVVRCLDSIIPLVSISKISSVYLASVAAQAGLSLSWSETPEDRFSHDEANLHCNGICREANYLQSYCKTPKI